MSTPVVVEIDNGVATLTIAREERRNSLDHVAMRMLEEALGVRGCLRSSRGR